MVPGSPVRRSFRLLCLLASILLPGCASDSSRESGGAVVWDSAGVQIVSNRSRSAVPTVYRIDPVPILDVGGLKEVPDLEFSGQHGYLRGTILSNGHLAVIDAYRVHLFDATGRLIRMTGRRGAGPSEFDYLTGICRTHGDTIVVGDSHNNRIAILDAEGTVVRTLPHIGSLGFDACFNDGSFVAGTVTFDPEIMAGRIVLRRHALTGEALDSLVTITATGESVAGFGVPIAAAGDLLYTGDQRTAEFRVYQKTGRLVRIIRSADTAVTITKEMAEARFGLALLPSVSALERQRAVERQMQQLRTTIWPVYGTLLLVDQLGRIWSEDFQIIPSFPKTWTVFDQTGTALGKLTIPEELSGVVLAFGEDTILLRRTDAEGAYHLAVHQIVK